MTTPHLPDVASPPPPAVLQRFGLDGEARPVPGGGGTAWTAAGAILKPNLDDAYQRWLGTVVSRLPQQHYRLPEILHTDTGEWTHDGWGAHRALPGETADTAVVDWGEVIRAGRAFHRETQALGPFRGAGTLWTEADRHAWAGPRPDVVQPLRELVHRLHRLPPPPGPDQLIHADLTGNVLLAAGHPPGIIDISPQWRPASYADGILLADVLTWRGGSASLLAEHDVAPPTTVARGLLFRLHVTDLMHRRGLHMLPLADTVERAERTLTAIGL